MNIRVVLAVVSLFHICVAQAAPDVVYRYSREGGKRVSAPVAIVELESAQTESGSGCEQRLADMVIDEVVYEGSSDMVIGFRGQKPGNKENSWYGVFSMDTKALYRKLPNPARHDPQAIVKRGAKVLVTYQVCGSGGYASVRDLWLRSVINNP